MSSLFRNRSSKSPRELVRSLKTNIAVVSDDESSDKKKDKVSLCFFFFEIIKTAALSFC